VAIVQIVHSIRLIVDRQTTFYFLILNYRLVLEYIIQLKEKFMHWNSFRMLIICVILLSAIPGYSRSIASIDSLGIMSMEVVQGKIFVGLTTGNVCLSTDSGKTWTDISDGLCNPSLPGYLWRIRRFATVNDTVYIATPCGVYWFDYDNKSWNLLTEKTIIECTCLHAFQNTLYAGTDSAIYKYEKSGKKWVSIGAGVLQPFSGNFFCKSIVHLDTVLFAVFYGNVYKSVDRGDTWTNLSDNPVVALSGQRLDTAFYGHVSNIQYLTPIDSGLVAITLTGAEFRSVDFGSTWILIHPGCLECSMPVIKSVYTDASDLYLGSYSRQISVSHDGGLIWLRTGYNKPATAFCFARLGDYLVVGTERGIFFSQDNFTTCLRYIPAIVSVNHSGKNFASICFSNIHKGDMSVYDLTGRLLSRNGNFSVAGKSRFPVGVYIARVQGYSGTKSQQFIQTR
jgi:hypothetical protein